VVAVSLVLISVENPSFIAVNDPTRFSVGP
jgi:hypothetical protein